MNRWKILLLAPFVLYLLKPSEDVAAELLTLPTVECPQNMPSEACFHSRRRTKSIAAGYFSDDLVLPLDDTLAYVHELLQEAIKVEHGTIPLYLTTLYSIKNASSFAAQTIKSVVIEEMLHMVQAANVLNAVGGAPHIDRPDFIPEYPLVLPLINISASITWFARDSVKHYQTLESVPPQGYNSSISAAYLHIVKTLDALCRQYGEAAVFHGDPALQVETMAPNGQSVSKVFSLANATEALLGVSDQGGGCPVDGEPWPEFVNISAGPLGGDISHAARYDEILIGRKFKLNDTVGKPTGETVFIDWDDVRKFTPNPSVENFLPSQCVAGGKWILRNNTFFVDTLLSWKGRLYNQTTSTWQECASLCTSWTVNSSIPLDPCAMWTWQDDPDSATDIIPYHTCMLGQQWVPPNTTRVPGMVSGCQYNTVCNSSIPSYQPNSSIYGAGENATKSLQFQCKQAYELGSQFARNYTSFLVSLHNVFNGQPEKLPSTLMQMYQLKFMAQNLMETDDPRIPNSILGIGPPWQYIANASDYQLRGGQARPINFAS